MQVLLLLVLMTIFSTASECVDQCPDGFTLWSAVSTNDVCKSATGQVCGICSSTETKCSELVKTAVIYLYGEDKSVTQQLNVGNFVSLCNDAQVGFQSPTSTGVTCDSVELVSQTDGTGNTKDEVLKLSVTGLMTVIDPFVASVGTSGLDIAVYGKYVLYTTSAPTESPGSDGSGSTGSGGFGMSAIAAGVATCNQFQNAGTKGVLYTDKPDGAIPCAKELKITTVDEKKAMHEAVNPTVELWVFSDTDAASTALATELRNMNYYTVTDLGGRDLKVKDCACVSAAVIDVESADYSNQVAGAVVCAIIAVLLSCALCYCLGNNKEMYPVESMPQHDEKADDVEEATAKDVKADAGVDRKIFDSQWTPEETLDDQLEDKFDGGNEHTAI